MDSARIVNASPLIFLTQAGLLDVLREAMLGVIVPDVVIAEIGARGPSDPAVQAVRQCPWIQVLSAPPIAGEFQSWNLDPGESAVIALALSRPGSSVVLDDLAARRCARSLAIPLEGTLSLIPVAKQIGMIPAVRPVFESLRESGMYVSDRLIALASSQAGE